MTKKEKFIYDYLFENKDRFVSPTEIGEAYGLFKFKGSGVPNCYHSAVASPVCLRLVKSGQLERNAKGHYKFSLPF